MQEFNMLSCHVPKTGGTFLNLLINYEAGPDVTGYVKTKQCSLKLLKHSTIKEYKIFFSHEEWKALYKFTCIRNPYCRFISYYLNHIIFESDFLKKLDFKDSVLSKTFNNWVQNDYLKIIKNTKLEDNNRLKKINSNIFDFYLTCDNQKIDFDYIIDFDKIPHDTYYMIYDYFAKHKDISKYHNAACQKLYKKVEKFINHDTREINISNKALKELNPSKSKSLVEKEAIEEIQLIGTEYFDKDSLAIFSSYNNKDIELYNNFIKRKNDISKAAYVG